jgi:peptide/nickel transport system substrate-binding protein
MLRRWGAVAILLLQIATSHAVTLRVANQGDVQSMDPHSFNESLQLSFVNNIYEPLVARDRNLRLEPGLAIRWTQAAPTVWRFELRRGVRFHDGTPFTADDVVFSFERAAGDGSDMKSYTATFKAVRRIDDHTVEIETAAPFPILPDVIASVYMMGRSWCVTHKAQTPVDRRKGVENAASFHANGTGPFRLKERRPAARTVLVRNPDYWGRVEGNVDELVFTPIGNDATRVAALLSGEIDLMEPVPLQDVERVRASPGFKLLQGPELRVIFLGMDQQRDELLYADVRGRNPFRDHRVRQAVYQAIDIASIRSRVMRGAANPVALMVAPGVNGFMPELNQRLPYDADAARTLLAQAGYPQGFGVGLNCPNDRYVNDATICQAVAAQLARVGIKVDLRTESKATYFPKILRRDTSFYLMGWTPSTYDAHDVLSALIASPDDKGRGQYNLGGYRNSRVDELTTKLQSEVDVAKRNAMIREAFRLHQDDVGHIPLHQQALAWGVKKNIDVVQQADNFMPYKWIIVR